MIAVLLLVSIVLDPAGNFRVMGWPDAAKASASNLPEIFTVRVEGNGTSDLPPVAGTYSVVNSELIFKPRYPLQPGLKYSATLTVPGQPPVTERFVVPARSASSSTSVDNIYPSGAVVPENLLKFYIYFSDAMSRGEAYRHIRLLNAAGEAVPLPFLELNQELWDPASRRFTLYFDPGRIKSGLLPNRESGLPIKEGQSYTLVVDREWRDADGQPLKQAFKKTFRVGQAVRQSLDISTWRITVPKAGTTEPVVVEFVRPLDRALLEHQIEVVDRAGMPVVGIANVGGEETQWRFIPDVAWKAGTYRLRLGELLADVSGNTVNRPFEVDRLDKQTAEREIHFLPFQVSVFN